MMDSFVARHLKGVSRTYAILIPMLPRGLADAVGLAYLLMRIVDTVEDAPQLGDDERLVLLNRLEVWLAKSEQRLELRSGGEPADAIAAVSAAALFARPLGDLPAEQALVADATVVFEKIDQLDPEYRAAIGECAGGMIAGVCRLLERSRERSAPYPAIQDAGELREYCHYVAGVVGAMLCRMMAHYLRTPGLNRLRDMAVELGIGLQLVNILKDALKDSQQGRRYLPQTAAGGVSQSEIYRAVLGEARASLQRGAEFVLALPAAARELRSFCGLPIAWGAMTLARAERDAGQAKIGRGAIRASIRLFGKLVGDDAALRGWLQSMLRPGARTA